MYVFVNVCALLVQVTGQLIAIKARAIKEITHAALGRYGKDAGVIDEFALDCK